MANRDFNKIERIMKDFSLNIGEGGDSNTTHICIFIERTARQRGTLSITYNGEDLELTQLQSPTFTSLYDVIVPLNEEVKIKYVPKTDVDAYFFNNEFEGNFEEVQENVYVVNYAFTEGGIFSFNDKAHE